MAFAALSGAIADIFIVNLETGKVRDVTNDAFGDYAPTYAPDGKSLVYLARVSGNDKLFRLDLASGAKPSSLSGARDGVRRFVDDDTPCSPRTPRSISRRARGRAHGTIHIGR